MSGIAARLNAISNPRRLKLLAFLTQPHYLEEIANHLMVNRSATKRHMDELAAAQFVRSRLGRRENGPVREYIVAPEAFFDLCENLLAFARTEVEPRVLREADPLATRGEPGGNGQALAAPRRPQLVVVHGVQAGRSLSLTRRGPPTTGWVIGRDERCELSLPWDGYVSKRHARVVQRGDAFEIGDLSSSNGTWVNWRRMEQGDAHPLQAGDIVGLGRTLLVFQAPTSP